MFYVTSLPSSLKNNKKVFMNVVSAVMISPLRFNPIALRTAKTQSFGCSECNRVKIASSVGVSHIVD